MRRLNNTDLALLSKDLGAKLPPPNQRKKRNNEESKMQRAVISWWHGYSKERGIPECLLFAIPNGAAMGHGKEEYQVKQRQIRGKIMKLEGLRPGCPDLFLAKPRAGTTYMGINHCGLFIEMKLPNGVVADDQKAFIPVLQEAGYQVHVCRSAEDAIETIKQYLA